MSSSNFLQSIGRVSLYLEIDILSFRYEIIVSGIGTMIIFGIELVRGMKTYRRRMEELKNNRCTDIPTEEELMKKPKDDRLADISKKKESKSNPIVSESVTYLAYVFVSIVGGFFICFHLILFIVILCSLIIFHASTYQIVRLQVLFTVLSFVMPVVVLYGLKSCLIRWLCIFASSTSESGNYPSPWNKTVYTSLVYLTFFLSEFVVQIRRNRKENVLFCVK